MADFFWALAFLLGFELLSLPLRVALAGCGADGAVRRVVSRLAGPAVLCLLAWIPGHSLPAVTGGWAIWLVVALSIAAWWLQRSRGADSATILGYERGDGWFGRIGLEIVSAILFFGFVALRRHCPEMTAYPINSSAAEKFTNAMLFWSSWHAGALPPQDYWLAGHSLVYYYFGHFFWAWTGHMIAAPGELVINLALARLTVMVFESAWLLGRAVGLTPGWSAAAGIAAAWGGNIAGVMAAWKLVGDFSWGGYPYWDARSVMPGTVNEFPAFTAILGDFHSHHMALPWAIGWLALMAGRNKWLDQQPDFRPTPALAVMVAWIALGTCAALANLWLLPLMAWAILIALAATVLSPRRLIRSLIAVVAFGLVLWVGIDLMRGSESLPLNQGGGGLPLKLLPAEVRSTFGQLAKFWGLPVIVIALAALARAIELRGWNTPLFLAGLILAFASFWFGPLLWLAVACWSAGRFGPKRQSETTCLLFGVLAVLIGLEAVFIDDFYSGEYERYNTYFKFSYPLWPALVVVAAAAASGVWSAPTAWVRWVGRICIAVIAVAAAVYPVLAFPARIIQARSSDATPMPPTLDAVDFLKYCREPWRSEAPIMEWIRRNVPAGSIVAEAPGPEPYSYGGRVACLAGRPIPVGWTHHEVQWRGPAAQDMIQRQTESIERIYRGQSPDEVRAAALRAGVRWILFGIEEERRYGPHNRARLSAAGSVAVSGAGGRYALIDLGEHFLEGRK
ncbi:MAG: DUF2298 domain-containing protein [Candidatus Sumerlaeia bacterium]